MLKVANMYDVMYDLNLFIYVKGYDNVMLSATVMINSVVRLSYRCFQNGTKQGDLVFHTSGTMTIIL